MSYEFPCFAPQGWQCPICMRVYSPTTPMCYYCGNIKLETTTASNIDIHREEKEVIKRFETEGSLKCATIIDPDKHENERKQLKAEGYERWNKYVIEQDCKDYGKTEELWVKKK